MGHRVQSFFDTVTFTWTHVLWDSATDRCAVIDPVLDYDPQSGRIDKRSANRIVDFVCGKGLHVDWIIETHAHADHLTAAQDIKERLGGVIAIGADIRSVQQTFSRVFNLGPGFAADGRQFGKLLADGDRLALGDLEIIATATPGHTGDSMSFLVGNIAFIGDTLFRPEYGTARCDFPGGDARRLYKSIQSLLSLPPETLLYLCHDYPERDVVPLDCVSVAEQRRNKHLCDTATEDEFVAMRESRDAQLDLPRLLWPAIQINIRAGRLPEPDDNGVSYLRIPLNTVPGT